MKTKELLEDIKKRGLELAKICEEYRDMHKKGTYEYGFRDGQATTWHNQVIWAEEMLEIFYPENTEPTRSRGEDSEILTNTKYYERPAPRGAPLPRHLRDGQGNRIPC